MLVSAQRKSMRMEEQFVGEQNETTNAADGTTAAAVVTQQRRNSRRTAPPSVVLVRHLDQEEVASRWSISPRTLERWRWIGQGPRFLKIGGRVVYRVEDIEAYEAEQLRTSTLRIEAGAR